VLKILAKIVLNNTNHLETGMILLGVKGEIRTPYPHL